MSDQTPIRLSVVVSLIALAATAGAAHFRIGANEKATEALIIEAKAAAREMAEVKTSAAVGANDLRSLKDEMAKANDKLDRLLEAKATNADYRPQRRVP